MDAKSAVKAISFSLMGFLGRLKTDENAIRDASVAAWAKGLEGVTLLRDAEERELVKVAGIVASIRVQPRDSSVSFEAGVTDGTGKVRAIWLGRKGIAGLRLGSRLQLEGRLGRDSKGHLQLVNPVYELEARN